MNCPARCGWPMQEVTHCRRCRNFCEREICEICEDQKRTAGVICVVESPSDVVAIEQSGGYRGRYFVLMGRLFTDRWYRSRGNWFAPVAGTGAKQPG